MEEKVEFKRVRDFGELIQASFIFVRQEFKQLFTVLLIYAGPLILISSLATAYFLKDFVALSTNPDQLLNSGYGNNPLEIFADFAKPFSIIMLFSVVSMVMITGITLSYIKNYVDLGAGNFTKDDVWNTAKEHMFAYFGYYFVYSFVISITAMLSFFVLGALGIYLAILWSLIFVVRTMENKGLGDSISRSSELIKGNWWSTFGFYIVLSIIISVITQLLSIPQGILQATSLISGTEEISIVYIVFASLTTFCSSLLYVIMYSGQALLYFSLIERKESPDLEERINNIV